MAVARLGVPANGRCALLRQLLCRQNLQPFVPYPIVAFYVICLTLTVIFLFGRVNACLNRHLPQSQRARIRLRPQLIR